MKSFARIHETNLRKQGMLPLTFANPVDYEKIQEDDRITLNVTELAPGTQLTEVITHADGGKDIVMFHHTMNAQ